MANIYLDANDVNFSVINANSRIFGQTGAESVFIRSGATGVVVDQNVERVDFEEDSGQYTFRQAGNQLQVYDAAGSTLLGTVAVQGDTHGTQCVFANGSVELVLSGGVMTLGEASVGSTPAAVTPVQIDAGTVAGDGTAPANDTSVSEVSADVGTLTSLAQLDAAGGGFNFLEDAAVANNVEILNFTSDDVITISNAAESDYSFSNNGSDVSIVFNEAGVVNHIHLTGVVDAGALVYDQASFETAIGFNAFTA